MELEVLEQPKSVFSLKSPSSFFAAFRRKPRVKFPKGEDDVPSHKGSFLNTKEEQTPRSTTNFTNQGPTFDMWSDFSTTKDAQSCKPLRKSILIRTTSLPISHKKPLEETNSGKEAGKGPLKKMAQWLGGMKESVKSDPSSLVENLTREKKNKKVTFAIEDAEEGSSEQIHSLKSAKKHRKSIKPTLEKEFEDTSIEFLETNDTPFGDFRFKPTPNNDYFFTTTPQENVFKPKVITKQIGLTLNRNETNSKQRENISSSDSENENENEFGLKGKPDIKNIRRRTEDNSIKLPSIGTPFPAKAKSGLIPDTPQNDNAPKVAVAARKLGSFSVRGASTVNLANMLYPIKRNIRVEREINRDYDFDGKQLVNDSDFSSKLEVTKQGVASQRETPLSSSLEPNFRLLVNTSNFPKSPTSLALVKRHTSLGLGNRAAEL